MTDMTAFVQKPDLIGAAPTYTQCTASDTFTASPNSMYILHYKNGATPQATGPNKVTDTSTPIPTGSAASAGFADASDGLGSGIPASTERVRVINNSSRFRSSAGVITLVHAGTLTTLSVAILGPFPAY